MTVSISCDKQAAKRVKYVKLNIRDDLRKKLQISIVPT